MEALVMAPKLRWGNGGGGRKVGWGGITFISTSKEIKKIFMQLFDFLYYSI